MNQSFAIHGFALGRSALRLLIDPIDRLTIDHIKGFRKWDGELLPW